MADPDPSIIECLKENWQHARHVENERLSFTQFYAMIVGAVVTILVQWSDRGPVLVFALAAFLLLLSILGLLLAQKWGQTFDKHMERGRRAADRLGVTDFMVFPGQPDQYSMLGRALRTKNLFCYFYAAVIGVSTGVMVYSLSELIPPSILVSVVTAVLASVIACRDFQKSRQADDASFDRVAG